MRAKLFLILLLLSNCLYSQTTDQVLSKAWDVFTRDPQLKHAMAAITIVESKNGKTIFEKNGEIGLSPASTQKVITSVAAFELLGKNYQYKTVLGYSGRKLEDSLNGILIIRGSGDPSLGSARYTNTKANHIFYKWITAIESAGFRKLSNEFSVDESGFDPMRVPGGWIVDDIGNYYGAGAGALNWRENQYDLQLTSSTKLGDPVQIKSVNGQLDFNHDFNNQLKAAGKGTGDNAYIYLPLEGSTYQLRGTIPVSENHFEISGAIVNPAVYLLDSFKIALGRARLFIPPNALQLSFLPRFFGPEIILDTHLSPSFDSLNYYFLRKSINLYGEAFVKTIALVKQGYGSTEKGIEQIKKLFTTAGVDPDAISIIDGSGLSPQNRVTTNAITAILQYARRREWFPSFYAALPEFNGMKMKSGYISGVRSFCGYHQSKKGVQYSYSIIVNNFTGSSAEITKKIYKLLDYLK